MNILIVGNGFDLSHYLPTKYDHFMDVMKTIEKKDLGKPIQNIFRNPVNTLPDLILKALEIKTAVDGKTYKMDFDTLFSTCRDKKFIDQTKEIYDISSIDFSLETIVKFQYELKNNCWYQYFKKHVQEIKTWIDFEQKIEQVLIIVARCINDIEGFHNLENLYQYFDYEHNEGLKIRKKDQEILSCFNFFSDEFYESNQLNNLYHKSNYRENIGRKRLNINAEYCYGNNLNHGLNPLLFLEYLMNALDDFIELFNLYLVTIVKKLEPKFKLKISNQTWTKLDQVYSFNYTNTYQRIYENVDVDFLHGSSGEEQNIVLGVSDLMDESLKKLKAYGFTKYHQKLFKDTDYLFLDNYKNKISQDEKDIFTLKEEFKSENRAVYRDDLNRKINQKKNERKLNLNMAIWGHSLDVSDKDYIIDLFSLNDDMDRNVRVTVYYFDKNAKFMLLNNLLSILGKDKVEQWMKNKWLVFKPNPEIKFNEMISEKTA